MPLDLNGPAQIAANLAALAKEFKSGDPVQSTAYRLAFKDRSKNDLTRSLVYLMEVVGARDAQYKTLQEENKDLKELLKLNNISLEETENESPKETAEKSETTSQESVQTEAP